MLRLCYACGAFVVHLWCVCGTFVVRLWYVCGTFVVPLWCVCGKFVVRLFYFVVLLWYVCCALWILQSHEKIKADPMRYFYEWMMFFRISDEFLQMGSKKVVVLKKRANPEGLVPTYEGFPNPLLKKSVCFLFQLEMDNRTSSQAKPSDSKLFNYFFFRTRNPSITSFPLKSRT